MNFKHSFKHMETSHAITSYAEKKIIEETEKFITKPIEVHLTYEVDRHLFGVHGAVVGGDGFNFQVEHVCEDMYGSIDRLVDKLTTQVKRQKERLKHHKVKKPREKGGYLFAVNGGQNSVEYDNLEIDAEDILKYENTKRRASGS